MSKALKEIEAFRRATLSELYHKCTEKQQAVFCRMYGSLEAVPDVKVDWAIQQCEATIKKNNAFPRKK